MMLNKIKSTAICASLFLAIGCTDDFNSINQNPYGLTNEQLTQDFNHIKSPFQAAFNGVFNTLHWKYQLQQNLNADLWSGYMATPTGFRGGSNNATYDLVDGWNGFVWSLGYTDVMANLYRVEQLTKGSLDQVYALSLILKVQSMQRMTDTFGPIVYSKFGTTDPLIAYDSQEDVYKAMFKELDFAVTELTKRIDANEKTIFAGTDLTAYEGNYTKWVRFANSLRLRLAMRIVKVNPTLAKSEAEKAIAQKFGVFTTKDDVAKIQYASTFIDPLKTISSSWGDIRMSADMESIMGGYNDPRLAKYFSESIDFPGQYRGVRNGIDIVAKSDRTGMSELGAVVAGTQKVLMSTAEVYFLRSEGALRGWAMGGNAQGLYESGIKSSFEQYGLGGADAYLADNVKKAKDFVDVKSATNNSAAVNNVTVAWDNAALNEVKLQKIITQKWIAGFPEGQEAWSEYRRTGYPKLFKVVKNLSGGKISTELGPRRINFVQSEKDGNPGGVATGLSKLGGADTGGTRLWWDTTGANF